MKIHYKSFVAGILVVTALKSLYQDSVGLDNYIEIVKANWISWKVSVPLTIVILLSIPLLLRKP